MANVSDLLRHIQACNSARLPGDRLAFLIGAAPAGWVKPGLAEALLRCQFIEATDAGIVLTKPDALPGIAKAMSDQGYCRWRREGFDVRALPGGPVLATIDRGAIPAFGIEATGVHVNGLVERADGLHLWVARRALNKALDPGKLDHIVAGGVSAGMGTQDTLIKEAGEEAAIPPALAARAQHRSVLSYAMERPEGLRRDRLHCYDLMLPAGFVPSAADGEVESFELWPTTRVLEAVRETGDFKFNVNLVLIDLFIRLGTIGGDEAVELRSALNQV